MIDFNSVLQRNFLVRYRKISERHYLIFMSSIREIDAEIANLWKYIDGSKPIAQIIEDIHNSVNVNQRTSNFAELSVRLMQILSNLINIQFVDVKKLDMAEIISFQNLQSTILINLMQLLERGSESLLIEEDSKKLFKRFWRIAYECHAAHFSEALSESGEEEFLIFIDKKTRENPLEALSYVVEFLGVTSWRFDKSENKIIIVRGNSVYSGDIDHRL